MSIETTPATTDAQALVELALDNLADSIAADLPATRYGSPTEVTQNDVLHLAGENAIGMLMAIMHADATPAVEAIRQRTQQYLANA